tara:strand:- start:965 stop:1501 length:537 start_codon:yes stop_codon:yes gene_type:complete
MAEAFSNKLTRAAGIVSTSSSGSIGIQTNLITGISTVDVAINDLVDNSNFILGTKITAIGVASVTCDRNSTNTSATSSQSVKFLGPTTAYTSTSTKSILVGGTFANNTGESVNLTVQVFDNSASTEVGLAANIPVPHGSSFVISDTGKTVLESSDEIRIYCSTANAIDATLSVLTGVS